MGWNGSVSITIECVRTPDGRIFRLKDAPEGSEDWPTFEVEMVFYGTSYHTPGRYTRWEDSYPDEEDTEILDWECELIPTEAEKKKAIELMIWARSHD